LRYGLDVSLDLDAYLADRRAVVERELAAALDAVTRGAPPRLVDAMRYSLLAGGKRLRPILALAACEAVSGRSAPAIPVACAVEMIHTYSLVHDDLPAMDDDEFRRGRPTSHRVFGDALAILAGDALLTEAFRIAARTGDAGIVEDLARAAGAEGMVGGQVLDVAGAQTAIEELEAMHRAKTGELLAVSVSAGARAGGASAAEIAQLASFGYALGLAFQIVDDLLDVTADLATLGKDPGSDRAGGKRTFVDVLGIAGARARAEQVMRDGVAALASLGARADVLAALGRYAIERDR
jgi:geranylgeranyl diphosphate synthase type II